MQRALKVLPVQSVHGDPKETQGKMGKEDHRANLDSMARAGLKDRPVRMGRVGHRVNLALMACVVDVVEQLSAEGRTVPHVLDVINATVGLGAGAKAESLGQL